MKILYEKTDISSYVQVRSCILRDGAGDRCDSLEIELENAGAWYRWGPKEDDSIQILHDGYDSGILFLHSVMPEDGCFRIHATALPCSARERENRSYLSMTLEEIIRACAIRAGMKYELYGLDGRLFYSYLERREEGAAAFLNRLLRAEGAALKCINGRFCAIGLRYAQDRNATQTIRVLADQEGAAYYRSGEKLRTLTVRTPWAIARAEDTNVEGNAGRTEESFPARDALQAGRWARGSLLDINRRCEELRLQSEFNRGFSALARIDVTGGTDADGEWLIQDVEHDLIEGTSTVSMHRCVRSIK